MPRMYLIILAAALVMPRVAPMAPALKDRAAPALKDRAHVSYEEATRATWRSAKFWDAFHAGRDLERPELARFRAFCDNLRDERNVGVLTVEPSGRTVDEQYRFPGLDGADGANAQNAAGLHEWMGGLCAAAATAQRELEESLANVEGAPLSPDHLGGAATERRGEVAQGASAWNRMGWLGSQYLPLRSAPDAWARTTAALRRGGVPAGHRFCGISRQAAGCRGKVHSDHHNFVLSTLTPLRGCTAATGIELDGAPTPLLDGAGGAPGATVVLDNTYDHVVYNDATSDAVDRFVLIVETWHPALTNAEREALSDLFALRDLFGLLEHKRAPFGISDEAATALLDRGARLDDWRLL
mmetsp:Transcript_26914/g.82840  ORF Transcript_26914/g.82840 Transcript_26914/m.82840 type:complete len:355 (+) Transcript_26914:893-1957(+)